MHCFIRSLIVFFVCLASVVRAEESRQWTREEVENPAERSLEFVEDKGQLSEFDQQTNRRSTKAYSFLAVIRIEEPSTGWGWLSDPKDPELALLQVIDGKFLLEPGLHSNKSEPNQKAFARFLDHIPDEQQPGKEALAFLASTEVNHAVFLDNFSKGTDFRHIYVFADSKEDVKSRAEAVLHVLDWGMFRSLQLKFFNELEKVLAEKREQQAVRDTRQVAMDAVSEELQEYEDVDVNTMTGLRLRAMEMEVEEVGFKAEMAAIDRGIEKTDKSNVELIRELEEARVRTEIELESLKARRDKIEEFVGKVKQKIILTERLSTAKTEYAQATNRLQRIEGSVAELQRRLERFRPPQIIDDQIVIRDLSN